MGGPRLISFFFPKGEQQTMEGGDGRRTGYIRADIPYQFWYVKK